MVVEDTHDVRINHSLGRLSILAVVNEEDVLTRCILQHGRSFDACLLQDERGFVVDGRRDCCTRIMAEQRQEARVGDGAANGVGIGAAVANDVDGAVFDDELLDAAPIEGIEALTFLPRVTVLACLADEKAGKSKAHSQSYQKCSLRLGGLLAHVRPFVCLHYRLSWERLSCGPLCILSVCTPSFSEELRHFCQPWLACLPARTVKARHACCYHRGDLTRTEPPCRSSRLPAQR